MPALPLELARIILPSWKFCCSNGRTGAIICFLQLNLGTSNPKRRAEIFKLRRLCLIKLFANRGFVDCWHCSNRRRSQIVSALTDFSWSPSSQSRTFCWYSSVTVISLLFSFLPTNHVLSKWKNNYRSWTRESVEHTEKRIKFTDSLPRDRRSWPVFVTYIFKVTDWLKVDIPLAFRALKE